MGIFINLSVLDLVIVIYVTSPGNDIAETSNVMNIIFRTETDYIIEHITIQYEIKDFGNSAKHN